MSIGWWILIGGVVAFFFFRSAIKSEPPASALPQGVALQPPPSVGDEIDEYDVVGESHYQRELARLCGPKGESGVHVECAAVLVPEPHNPHDKNAVRCEISGLKVGYLSRDDAHDFSKHMRRKKLGSMTVAATIRGGWKSAKSEGSYGVSIALSAETID